jgi:hypothetical protein
MQIQLFSLIVGIVIGGAAMLIWLKVFGGLKK